ncbi:MAG TPA: ATP-binding protein [Gemmatimonadales bacterium]|nr:ATP-binding protein [Gemmatimonadales bacterium]
MKLSTRLLVLLLPTMTIVMVGYLYWSMAEREDTLVSQAEQEMGAYGAALAVALRYAFHSNTHADFQRVINEVTRDPKIYAILVYDEGGNPLLVSDSVTTPSLAPPASLARVLATGKPVSFRRELEDRDVFSVLRPIYDQDGRISGALEVAQPLSFVQLQQQEMRKRFFFNTLTLLVVVTVLTLWLVRRLVAGPMQRFVGAVRALGQGELAHRIGPGDAVTGTMRGSELATLELEINTMAANLETARARIMREAEERVVLERRLRESEKMAAIGNLAAGLAHEIAAPLNVISGRAELLLQSESESSERHRNLGIIVRQIERITTIVRNLLDSGQRRLERQLGHVDVAFVLDGVAEFLDGELSRNEIALTRLYPRPLLVFGDPDLLHQVFVNLVLNAVQALETAPPPPPPAERPRTIALRGWSTPEDITHIEVADTGPGIPAAALPHLFEAFFTTKAKGTGLGLVVARSIVEELGGTLEAGNEPDGGAVFRITLPAWRAASTAVAGPRAPREPAHSGAPEAPRD